MLFWIVAIFLSLVTAAAVVAAVLRRSGTDIPAEAFDVAVYRDQLAEVERDRARGVVSEDEAERLKTEVSRRLLAADKAASAAEVEGKAPRAASLVATGLAGAVIVAGGIGIYWTIGAPGYPDLPLAGRIAEAERLRAERPGQAAAEAEAQAQSGQMPALQAPKGRFAELMDRLRSVVEERPNDVQGLELLARNEARLGNFTAAHEAAGRILAIKGDEATAGDYANYADLLILAAGGYVSPEAERALGAALSRDPENGTARYYTGLMYAQTGRPDLAFRVWRALLDASGPDDPWTRPVRDQIGDIAARAGVNYTLPPLDEAPAQAPGPSRDQIQAAEDMTPEDRQAMIRGMVDGLAERLGNEGGPPQDWARLIGALGVLGQTDRAAAIWAEAQTVFAASPEALDTIAQAARSAGVAE